MAKHQPHGQDRGAEDLTGEGERNYGADSATVGEATRISLPLFHPGQLVDASIRGVDPIRAIST